MNRHALRVAGILFLATTGSVAAQTGTPGMTGGLHTAIPKSNKSLLHTGGAKTGTGGLNLTAPIPKAGGATTGAGGTFAGFGGAKSGTGTAGGGFGGMKLGTGGTTGAGMTGPGGFGFGGVAGGPALSPGQEVALLAQARLLVTGLESTGNLTLDRRESLLLTLLVYEALRQHAAQPAAGGTPLPTTP